MKLKKVIMGITATVCTFSAIAPLNAHASELKKGNTASGFGNINVENTSFDFNQTFFTKR
ncbi:hypothetical protein ACT7DZ_10230 [Bacillus cereus]